MTCLTLLALAMVSTTLLARGDQPPRLDALGDPLPPQALLRLGTSRLGHADRLDHVAVSADGKSLATAGAFYDRFLCVWDIGDGKCRFRQEFATDSYPQGIALSPDGKKLAAVAVGNNIGRDAKLLLWDVATGKELLQLPLGKWDVQVWAKVAFSSDGTVIAVGGGNVWVVDLVKGKVRFTLPGHQDGVGSVAFHPGGRLLATGGKVVRFWDLETGKERGSLLKQVALAFAPDGTALAMGAGDVVLVHPLASPTETSKPVELASARELRGFKHGVTQIAFSPDGRRLLAGDRGGNCREFEVTTGEMVHGLVLGLPPAWPRNEVAAVAFPDGKPIAASRGLDSQNQTVRLWDVATGTELLADRGHLRGVRALAFAPGGLLISAGEDVRLWDTRTGRPLARCEGDKNVQQLLIAPSGKEVLAAGDQVTWWTLPDGKQLRAYDPKVSNLPTSLYHARTSLLPDGRTVAVPLIEIEKTPKSPMGFLHHIRGVALVDTEKRQVLRRLSVGQPYVRVSPDGRTLAAFGQGVEFWDLRRGSRIHQWEDLTSVSGVAFSADGQFVAGSQNEAITLWEVATRRRAWTWKVPREGPIQGLPSLAFSGDGRLLAAGTPHGSVHLWDVDAGKYLTVLKGHLGSIGALAFKPNGHVLASGSADRTVLLWDMGDYQDPAKTNPLLASELDELWQQLASPDPVKGLEAVTRLALGGPEVAVGVAKRLSPVPPTGSKRLAQLIADLDSARFPVRRAAAAELALLGELAETAMRKAREGTTSAEMRLRLDELLARTEQWTEDDVRARRALRVLERLGNVEARRFLERLGAGASEAWLTQEAKATLQRLVDASREASPVP